MSNLEDILRALACKYETKKFLDGDPSWFMHQVEGDANKELLAFIASALSYGSRAQFLPKIQYVLESSGGDIEGWLLRGDYQHVFPDDDSCYYRLYSNRMMRAFLDALALMIQQYGSMKAFVVSLGDGRGMRGDVGGMRDDGGGKREDGGGMREDGGGMRDDGGGIRDEGRGMRDGITCLDVIRALTAWFAAHGSSGVVPKNALSSCKRLCMFLRWMVRDGSPVDIGLWSDIIDRRTLIMPMDTHVVQEANRLGLIHSKSTTMAAAIKLTERLREIFPDDPLKGDFALFGYGIDNTGS